MGTGELIHAPKILKIRYHADSFVMSGISRGKGVSTYTSTFNDLTATSIRMDTSLLFLYTFLALIIVALHTELELGEYNYKVLSWN